MGLLHTKRGKLEGQNSENYRKHHQMSHTPKFSGLWDIKQTVRDVEENFTRTSRRTKSPRLQDVIAILWDVGS